MCMYVYVFVSTYPYLLFFSFACLCAIPSFILVLLFLRSPPLSPSFFAFKLSYNYKYPFLSSTPLEGIKNMN
ncbi:hypothetical protein, unlikely [Trypanosoma brucei brucei TREU927]|uniref:Uncharacterized protein n=1 Tax=Trypanosoma brucei brucei (strain 927/4 GUTat10.1) TaxID=185431 RepID=Q38FU2_TRYB2|nr:hypothetical protein, unlikely [Trypanosoma brucei brucei TREU927]EAN76328.1 hypothetical protein, unlikely [Trypanosoma brucei brucei TREU927]